MVARGSYGVYLVLWEPLDILAKKSEMVYTVTAPRISPHRVPLGGVSIQKGPWGSLSRPWATKCATVYTVNPYFVGPTGDFGSPEEPKRPRHIIIIYVCARVPWVLKSFVSLFEIDLWLFRLHCKLSEPWAIYGFSKFTL